MPIFIYKMIDSNELKLCIFYLMRRYKMVCTKNIIMYYNMMT